MRDFELVAISGPNFGPNALALSFSNHFKKELFEVKVGHFADGETNIRKNNFERLRGKAVFFIEQFSFVDSCSINRQLMDFLFALNVINLAVAERIMAFLPYFPYARQEVSILGKGLGLIGTFSSLLKTAGVGKVISCDLHEPAVVNSLPLTLQEIKLDEFWMDLISSDKLFDFDSNKSNVVLATPDAGGSKRVQKMASSLNLPFAMIAKKRVAADRTVVLDLQGDVKNKIVILIDDIIDTAGTALNACEKFLQAGAREIIGCFSHGVLSCNASASIERSNFSKVFITSTTRSSSIFQKGKISVVSIDDFLCKQVESFFKGQKN